MEISTESGTFMHTADGATLARVASNVATNNVAAESKIHVRGIGFYATLTVQAVSPDA